jgi:hypothetical protein
MTATKTPLGRKKKKRCQCLDGNGKQCRRMGSQFENYHGENELYNYFNGKPVWVRVWVCITCWHFNSKGERVN